MCNSCILGVDYAPASFLPLNQSSKLSLNKRSFWPMKDSVLSAHRWFHPRYVFSLLSSQTTHEREKREEKPARKEERRG